MSSAPQTIFEACNEAVRIREHLAMETEGAQSPRVAPTKTLHLTNEEVFAALDALRTQAKQLRHRPPSITGATLAAMRKMNDALVAA